MKRTWSSLIGVAILAVAAAGAQAQTETQPPSQSTPPPSQSTPPPSEATPPPAAVPATDQAAPQATQAAQPANDVLASIRERGASMDAKQKTAFDAKLAKETKVIDAEAAAKGDATVAGRLAGELNVSADALSAQRTQYNAGWGDLTIAHLLLNGRTDVTLDQLFQLHQEGQGWGQIAHGMDLNLGQLVSAVRSEGKVATGAVKADGKLASLKAAPAVKAHVKGADASKATPDAKGTVEKAVTPGGGNGNSGK